MVLQGHNELRWADFVQDDNYLIINTYDSTMLFHDTWGYMGDLRHVNSSPPSATYMSVNWVIIGSCNDLSPVRSVSSHLSEPMLAYCQLDSWEQISVKFEAEFYYFHSGKLNSKCRLPEWWPLDRGGELNGIMIGISFHGLLCQWFGLELWRIYTFWQINNHISPKLGFKSACF